MQREGERRPARRPDGHPRATVCTAIDVAQSQLSLRVRHTPRMNAVIGWGQRRSPAHAKTRAPPPRPGPTSLQVELPFAGPAAGSPRRQLFWRRGCRRETSGKCRRGGRWQPRRCGPRIPHPPIAAHPPRPCPPGQPPRVKSTPGGSQPNSGSPGPRWRKIIKTRAAISALPTQHGHVSYASAQVRGATRAPR